MAVSLQADQRDLSVDATGADLEDAHHGAARVDAMDVHLQALQFDREHLGDVVPQGGEEADSEVQGASQVAE